MNLLLLLIRDEKGIISKPLLSAFRDKPEQQKKSGSSNIKYGHIIKVSLQIFSVSIPPNMKGRKALKNFIAREESE